MARVPLRHAVYLPRPGAGLEECSPPSGLLRSIRILKRRITGPSKYFVQLLVKTVLLDKIYSTNTVAQAPCDIPYTRDAAAEPSTDTTQSTR